MKKILLISTGVVLATGALYIILGSDGPDYTFRTEAYTRGAIVRQVRATGVINPLQTVRVGSQVSGTVSQIFVDFNAVVTRGQVVAVIDSTFLSASVREAEANLQRTKAQLEEASRTQKRTADLFAKNLVSVAELDAARTAYETAHAQLRQSEAALERAEVNLRYAVIRSPIDGVVISRDVDVGQTVAASLSAPQLFAIANDLKRMQVEASVDEADIGQIKAGQGATFTVDSYPEEEFSGTVTQVRLSPVTVQNVVTYTVIIEVMNEELKLRPGMTATVSVLIDRRDDVFRIPAMALRFQPPADLLSEMAEAAEMSGEVGAGGSGRATAAEPAGERRERGARAGRADRGDTAWQNDSSRRRGDGSGGGWRRERGSPGSGMGRGDGMGRGGGTGRGEGSGGRNGVTRGSVWVLGSDGQLRRVGVVTGLTDQRYVEVLKSELREGDEVVVGAIETGGAESAQGARNPFSPQQQPSRNMRQFR